MEKLTWIDISNGVLGIKRQVAFEGLNSMTVSGESVKVVFLKRFVDSQDQPFYHPDMRADTRVIIDLSNQHQVHPESGMVIYPGHPAYENAVPQFDFWWPKFINGSFYSLMPTIVQQLDNLQDENGNTFSRFDHP